MPVVSPFDFSEEDILSWCDSVIAARADALQRAGHVLAPSLVGTHMTAEVLGTWSRVDRPAVHQDGTQLHFTCTCDTANCSHAMAMLLEWVREPDAFRGPVAESIGPLTSAARRSLTPEEQMGQLLHRYTMADLRALVKRRGLTVKGQLKDEYVERLAVLLLQPENINAAIEGLGDGDLMLLTLIDLLRGGTDSNSAGIRNAFHALWGRTHTDLADPNRTVLEATLNRLESLGLVVGPTYPGGNFEAPRAVIAWTPVPHALLELLPDHSAALPEGAEAGERTPSLVDLIQMLAHEVIRGDVRIQPPKRKIECGQPTTMWDVGERDVGHEMPGKAKNIPASVQLHPGQPIIPEGDLERLAGLTGVSPEQLQFGAELMLELDILQSLPVGRGAGVLQSERLAGLLRHDAAGRRQMLTSTWLTLSSTSDLRLLRGILDLRMDVNQVQWYANDLPAETSLRLLLARFVGRLATVPPRWYACSNLADVCEVIAPARLYRAQYALAVWWFTPPGRPDVPLRLDAQDGRRQVYRAIFGALLRGPLRWLGMVDVAEVDGELLFRPRPAAAILADREPDGNDDDAGTVSLLIEAEEDGTPILSVSASDEDDMALYITGVAELLPPSAHGVRYRVTGPALQRMFQSGISGTSLIAWMEQHSVNGVPENVRRRIEGASESFGTVRLYDDLTLLELGDDFLFRELEAVAGLRDMTIHVFSPRLLAVQRAQAATLIASLTKAGYRPRVLEAT